MKTNRLVHEDESNIVRRCEGKLQDHNLSIVPSSEEKYSSLYWMLLGA